MRLGINYKARLQFDIWFSNERKISADDHFSLKKLADTNRLKLELSRSWTIDSGNEFHSSMVRGKNDLLNALVEPVIHCTLMELKRRRDVRTGGTEREVRRSGRW